jgi:sister chromatid cohesion protein DCC1
MLPSAQLQPLLNLILTLLTIHMTSTGLEQSPPYVISPSAPILKTLNEDHDVPMPIITGVLDLFGQVQEDEWKCDIKRVVGEMGMGIVQSLPGNSKRLDAFLGDWKAEVGEMWAELVDIKLLEVSLPWQSMFYDLQTTHCTGRNHS